MKLTKIQTNFYSVDFLPNKDLKIYFSYETPIAFNSGGKLVIRQNIWNNTTGKHLNHVEFNKDIRIDSEAFNKALADL